MKSSRTTRLRLLFLLSMLQVLILTTDTFAQAIGVTGIIFNERTSGPAPGATIIVKNTNRYTVANEAGRFTIHAATGDVLLITMIEYVSKEVLVNVAMQEPSIFFPILISNKRELH